MKKITTFILAIFPLFIGLFTAPANAVVGGSDATGSGFVVAIRVDLGGNLQTACTGGLWKPKIVITAAHCVVTEGTNQVVLASNVNVYSQGANLSVSPPVAKASAIILTSGYENSKSGFVEDNDIAFLILDKDIGIPLVSRLASESEVAAATLDGIVSFVSTEAPLAYSGTSFFAKNVLAGTGFWSTLIGATDSTGRPIYSATNPWNAAGESNPTSIRGNVLGLDLYVDYQAVSTLADNAAFVIAPEAATWYESPTSYFSVNNVGNMEVQTAIYGYGSLLVKQAKGIRKWNVA